MAGRRRKITVDRELGLMGIAGLGLVLAAGLVAAGHSAGDTAPFLTISVAAISRMAPPRGQDPPNPINNAPDAAGVDPGADPQSPSEV